MTSYRKIGFIGTGIMGAPMARNLARAGFEVEAYDYFAEKAEALAPDGVTPVKTAVEAVSGKDAIVVMLNTGPICDKVLFGDDGAVAKSIPAGALLAVMSSIPVETAQTHAQKAKEYGFKYLDAPVSGGEKGAIEANLSIMVGGEPDVFEEAVPLFEAMGAPLHIGPSGTGQLTKLVNQLTVASTIVAVAEALLFAERGGADTAKVRQALLGGFAQSTILNQHGQRMIERNFKPGGPAIYQVKDTQTAKAYAAEIGLDLPVLNIVNDLFQAMCDSGDGDLDHSAVFRELCRHNKLTTT